MKEEKNTTRQLLTTSILLAMLALVSITAATLAWLTIADRTKVRSMRMEVTSGANLRFDLDPHETFEEYVKTLTFDQIAQRILRDSGFDPKVKPLTPVTTDNCVDFKLEDGSEAKKEYYLEFTLHFMAKQDMIVHLTSAHSGGNQDGTRIESKVAGVPAAMRISFTAEETVIYDPGMEGAQNTGIRTFGLPEPGAMQYNDGNALFSLKKDVDKPVLLRIWLEGTDEACTDALRGADYSIWMRFIGTDEAGNILEDSRTNRKNNVEKEGND